MKHNKDIRPGKYNLKAGKVFFKTGNKWNIVEKGGVVMGYVNHKGDLEIEKLL